MSVIRYIARGSCLISLVALLAGCVIAPRGPDHHRGYRDGYYDAPHHRYWHDNGWRDCHGHDPHCR